MTNGNSIPADTVAGRKGPSQTVISIDAMGGDQGPAAVVAGLALSAVELPDALFILHGRLLRSVVATSAARSSRRQPSVHDRSSAV